VQHLSRRAWIVACDEVVKGVEVGPARPEKVLFDAASAPCPAGASGNPVVTTPDHVFNIEFAGWTSVEAILDFRLKPGELLAAPL
jgi:hypothetical protein